ncbi:hypothetical protein NGRA_3042 [Nosema granulosis]|uniref:Retrotransposon gag domain-containing protein n=1 Tax=Nosema granulosis TaxID=83296 RepID=A0A9P6KXL2_9MICR|nr:hypothetical protein NGRA_3042 [Nosema granulosis]
MEDITNKTINMATAMKSLKEFTGTEEEDVELWLRESKLVTTLLNVNDRDTVKILVLKLKGKALSWATHLLNPEIGLPNWEEFLKMISKRFTTKHISDSILTRFMKPDIIRSRDEFTNILHDATVLYEKEQMIAQALWQKIIERSPAEIQGLLYQAACTATGWEQFVKTAEEVSWIAYPQSTVSQLSEEQVMNVSNTSPYQQQHRNIPYQQDQRKNCDLHGAGWHDTSECLR